MTEKIKWRKIVGRGRHPLLVTDIVNTSITKYTRRVQGCPDFSFYKRIGGNTFLAESDFKKAKNYYLKKLKKSAWVLIDAIKNQNFQNKKMIMAGKKISQMDLKKMTTKQLKTLFVKLLEIYLPAWNYIYTPWLFEEILIEKLEKMLKNKKSQSEITEIIYRLNILPRPSRNLKFKKELLKLACQINKKRKIKKIFIKKDVKEILKRISKKLFSKILVFQKKYQWRGSYLLNAKEYTLNDVIFELKEALKNNPNKTLKVLIADYQKEKANFKKIITQLKKLNLPSYFFIYVRSLQETTLWRQTRIEDLSIAHYYLKPLLAEIARRRKLNYDEIIELTINEILKDKGTKKDIQERKKGYGYVFIKGRLKIYTGKALKKLEKVPKEYQKLKKIEGMVAFPGKVCGPVQILHSVYQYKKIKPNRILVISMTTPEISLYVKKIKAIVTDEGGIICHAAILARELKIPCIIGTKIATKVLKDGDLVEVDADKGVVRKIKQAG